MKTKFVILLITGTSHLLKPLVVNERGDVSTSEHDS